VRLTTVFAVAAFALLGALPGGAAQELAFPSAAGDDPAALARAMPPLARALIATYATADRRTYLDTLFHLQIVAGRFVPAAQTLTALRRFDDPASPWSATNYAQYEIFVHAKLLEASGVPFGEAFERSFRTALGRLDDRHSALVVRRFAIRASGFESDLRSALASERGKTEISRDDALALVRRYQLATMYAEMEPNALAAIAEDDRRRYVIDRDRLVTMPDGGKICALIVRPRAVRRRLPTLLQFTIYADRNANLSEARRTASNGYVDVEALTRGKGCSPDVAVPYVHDGADGAAVVAWIARQPWSDGRIGMYGGSYNSFAQWAVAKRRPPALKALMPAVSAAPGIDVPMEGNVFQSFSYDWPFYVTTGKWLNANSQGDPAHWIALQKRWYASGKPYRAMDRIDGRANPIWDRWLRHPSYDAYWQRLVPYRDDFARISIPVLMTDGYLSGQNVGGLYYAVQYRRYNPSAEKYLVIGPYDHFSGQRGTVASLGRESNAVAGYTIDPAAHIDIGELRYAWFDYVFKGARKPTLLRGRINYEVMGANVWRHAASVDAMHERVLRVRLANAKHASIVQTIDLADRSDVDRVPSATGLDTYLGVLFESAPFVKGFELSGLFSGRLDFSTNKKDFDLAVSLYEHTAKGEYVAITYTMARVSYVHDRAHRRLLVPGRRTQLDFVSSRLTSWKIGRGSRIAVVLSIVKGPGTQLNYGTGKDVSDESIADAKTPLRIRWYGGTFVDVPASAPAAVASNRR